MLCFYFYKLVPDVFIYFYKLWYMHGQAENLSFTHFQFFPICPVNCLSQRKMVLIFINSEGQTLSNKTAIAGVDFKI